MTPVIARFRILAPRLALTLLIGLVLYAATAVTAQVNDDLQAGLQLNLSPPGARSLAMAGAFVGRADDATAAVANPAGLLWLSRQEISLEYRGGDLTTDYIDGGSFNGENTGMGIDDGSRSLTSPYDSSVDGLAFFSYVYPKTRWAIGVYRQEAVRRSEWLPPMHGDVAHQRRLGTDSEPTPSPDIVAVADRCDLHLVYVPGARNGGADDGPPEDVGNAILSTRPLSDPFAVEMPKEASRRVAVGAPIRGNDREEIRVVSVHFNTWPLPWKLLHSGNSSRVRQALALIDALEIVAHGSEERIPVVAGGDLNSWSVEDGALQHLRAYFSASPAWHGEPTRGAFPTDHLLLRVPGERSRASSSFQLLDYDRLDESYNSDHNPVTASLAPVPE